MHFCMVLVRQSSLSFKRTPPSVVLNDTWSPHQSTSTVNPQKPNLTRQFLRTAQTTTSKLKPKVTNFIQKFSQLNPTIVRHKLCPKVLWICASLLTRLISINFLQSFLTIGSDKIDFPFTINFLNVVSRIEHIRRTWVSMRNCPSHINNCEVFVL